MGIDKIAGAELMVSLPKKRGDTLYPPELVTDLEEAKELCNELVLSMCDLSRLCGMMPEEVGAVEDSNLRVHETADSPAVDTSIFSLEL